MHGMEVLCRCLVHMTNHDHAALCALRTCTNKPCQRCCDVGLTSSFMCANGKFLKEPQAGGKQHGHTCLCLFQRNQACMQVSPGPEIAAAAEQFCCSSAISAAFLHSSSALLTSPDTAATCAEAAASLSLKRHRGCKLVCYNFYMGRRLAAPPRLSLLPSCTAPAPSCHPQTQPPPAQNALL